MKNLIGCIGFIGLLFVPLTVTGCDIQDHREESITRDIKRNYPDAKINGANGLLESTLGNCVTAVEFYRGDGKRYVGCHGGYGWELDGNGYKVRKIPISK